MSDARGGGRTLGAVIAGAALGAIGAGGTAMLLYSGQGFIRAAGLLVSSTVMALAAGLWAGAPQDGISVRTGRRWAALIVLLLVGGAFTALWSSSGALRAQPLGGAGAVLLVLALPAYAAGSLLAGLHARDVNGESGIGAAAAAGAALGVLLTMSFLIQTLEAHGLYYAAAAAVSLASLLDRGAARQPERTMNDHVAVITGVAHSGQLGYTIARTFLAAGARVVITSRGDGLEDVARELGADDRVVAVPADLLDDAQLQRVFDSARERFGAVDSVINAVGGLTLIRDLAHTSDAEWQQEMQRNAETVLRVSRAALPLLRSTRGAIVNFASPAGETAVARLGAYSAAKAAVIAITRAMALEEKPHGVRVNAIAPGTMETAANRENAGEDAVFVSREDVAAVALFLAGPASAGISGETIHVAGPTLR